MTLKLRNDLHYLVKKCLFPLDAVMVWCPTWSKILGCLYSSSIHLFYVQKWNYSVCVYFEENKIILLFENMFSLANRNLIIGSNLRFSLNRLCRSLQRPKSSGKMARAANNRQSQADFKVYIFWEGHTFLKKIQFFDIVMHLSKKLGDLFKKNLAFSEYLKFINYFLRLF